MHLYIAGEGEHLGPYSLDQVKVLVRKGELTGQELAYHDGLENWVPLSEILPAEPTFEDFKYKAFISYSHQDKKWGDWLHKSLETYSIPKGLIGRKTSQGEVPKRLFPVFRDREELPTATELGTMIDEALKGSSHLVVICSPRSAKSQWVNEEIKQFKRLGKSDRILCLIVDGEPNGADKPEMGLEECFPEAVKHELGEDGELSEERTEPIAADAREGKDGKANALLKIVAGLLGVGFDDLKQRDAVRRQRRMMVLSGISGTLALVMGGLAIWAWTQRNEAIQQRKEAVKQKGIAEVNLQKAETVSEFIGGIFSAVKPGELGNVDDKDKDLLKLVLNKGAERIKKLEDQPEVEADIRFILGNAFNSFGFYDEALTHHQRALTLRLKLFGPEHSDVAVSHNAIGMGHHKKGDYDPALEHYQKSLAIRIKQLGPEHFDVAESYNNIGMFHHEKGDYDQAIEYLHKSLAINLSQLGSEHLQVATSYNNIGLVHYEKSDHDKAREFFQKALAIDLKQLGPEHPRVGGIYSTIAGVHYQKGELDKALEFTQKGLAIRIKQLGPKHPNVANSYNNIGMLHYQKSHYDKALEFLTKALAIDLDQLGPDHPSVAGTYNNIGMAYLSKGNYERALEFLPKALAIRLKTQGPDHPDVAISYYNIGAMHFFKREHKQAIGYWEKAYAIRLKKLGANHPDTKYVKERLDVLKKK